MKTTGYLGIDAGTQGLSAVFVNQDLELLATGDGHYQMVEGLNEGCYEQSPQDWLNALTTATTQLWKNLRAKKIEFEVLAIGISGQMHGEVLCDENGRPVSNARLWCDVRNEAEGKELTDLFGAKVPKRMTVARWLWTIREQPEVAKKAVHMTTPAGWIAQQLTGEWNLGIGDAAGMFPIDQSTLDYDQAALAKFGTLKNGEGVVSLDRLLPKVCCAGDDGGTLTVSGGQLLGLDAGIPVAPAEGDQPAALAGSLIGKAGMVSVSFGTSVCANSVGDRPFVGVSESVDHFCAPDGKPINMVWLRNGTTFMNTAVEMFGSAIAKEPGAARDVGFESVIPQVLNAAPDCGGIIALPFMDDEPGLQVAKGGTAMFVGLNSENATAGNVVKAALLSTIFNLRLGSELLDEQGYPRSELVLTGGLTRTPELAQVLADVFDTPVTLLSGADEGTAWGATLLAKFRELSSRENGAVEWSQFLDLPRGSVQRYQPDPNAVQLYNLVFQRYQKLVALNGSIGEAIA